MPIGKQVSSSARKQFAGFADQCFHIVSLGNDSVYTCGGGFPLQDVITMKRAENNRQLGLTLVKMAGRFEAVHDWHR